MSYKQLAAALLTGTLLLCSFGCASRSESDPSSQNGEQNVKLGVSLTALRRVEVQKAQIEGIAAAVLVDEEGKILACKLDEWELPLQLSDGKLDTVTDWRTKAAKKEDYGLKENGSVYEWYEQAAAFCAYVKGMTAADVASIPLNDGKAADADLVSKCSIVISGFVSAVEQAVKNAVLCDAAADDTLGLAITLFDGGESRSVEITGEVSAVACDAQGKVTAAFIDEIAMPLSVNEGNFTDKDGAFSSKKQQGTAYGMKAQSAIGKEWFEQVHTLETALLGKTATGIRSLPLKDGRPADADIAAGCTIDVSSLLVNAIKAVNDA